MVLRLKVLDTPVVVEEAVWRDLHLACPFDVEGAKRLVEMLV